MCFGTTPEVWHVLGSRANYFTRQRSIARGRKDLDWEGSSPWPQMEMKGLVSRMEVALYGRSEDCSVEQFEGIFGGQGPLQCGASDQGGGIIGKRKRGSEASRRLPVKVIVVASKSRK